MQSQYFIILAETNCQIKRKIMAYNLGSLNESMRHHFWDIAFGTHPAEATLTTPDVIVRWSQPSGYEMQVHARHACIIAEVCRGEVGDVIRHNLTLSFS